MSTPLSTDVVLVNRAGTDYQCTLGDIKLSMSDVRTVFGRTGAIVAVDGDYTLNLLGDVDLSVAPTNGQALLYDSGTSRWKAGTIAGSGTVLSVSAGLGLSGGPITTTGSLSIDRTTTDTWYAPGTHVGSGGAAHLAATTATAGFMSAADKLKLNGIADGATAVSLSSSSPADLGTPTAGVSANAARADHVHAVPTASAVGALATVTGTSPISVSGSGTSRTVSVADATTTTKGVVQLADASAIAAGTPGRVVDASQLAIYTPVLTSTAAVALGSASAGVSGQAARADHVHPMPTAANIGALAVLNGTAPIGVSGAGDTRTISVSAASTTAAGVVQLADGTAITAGTTGRVVDAAQLKAAVPTLSSTAGAALASSGSAGVGTTVARADHVHPFPTAANVGALATLSGTAPITISGSGDSRTIAVSAASTAAAGVVQLADAAAITAGTSGRVVDAAQLKNAGFIPLDFSTLSFLP